MILSDVKGIGPKSEKVLNKMGIFTPDDLISFFPFRYEVIERTDIFNLKDGDKIIIDGVPEVLTILRRNHPLPKNFLQDNYSPRI